MERDNVQGELEAPLAVVRDIIQAAAYRDNLLQPVHVLHYLHGIATCDLECIH